jgi:hypothetical protein
MIRRYRMDKILSARVDESVVNRIGSLARRLHTSKKKIIESAIETYAAQVDKEQDFDVFEHTLGLGTGGDRRVKLSLRFGMHFGIR